MAGAARSRRGWRECVTLCHLQPVWSRDSKGFESYDRPTSCQQQPLPARARCVGASRLSSPHRLAASRRVRALG
eukprot:scaffold23791_cov109-Isochrysis_galbana.AAC.4